MEHFEDMIGRTGVWGRVFMIKLHSVYCLSAHTVEQKGV